MVWLSMWLNTISSTIFKLYTGLFSLHNHVINITWPSWLIHKFWFYACFRGLHIRFMDGVDCFGFVLKSNHLTSSQKIKHKCYVNFEFLALIVGICAAYKFKDMLNICVLTICFLSALHIKRAILKVQNCKYVHRKMCGIYIIHQFILNY